MEEEEGDCKEEGRKTGGVLSDGQDTDTSLLLGSMSGSFRRAEESLYGNLRGEGVKLRLTISLRVTG